MRVDIIEQKLNFEISRINILLGEFESKQNLQDTQIHNFGKQMKSWDNDLILKSNNLSNQLKLFEKVKQENEDYVIDTKISV